MHRSHMLPRAIHYLNNILLLTALSAVLSQAEQLPAKDERAEKIILPLIDLREVEPWMAMEKIWGRGFQADKFEKNATKRGINIILLATADQKAELDGKTITILRQNLGLHETVKECAKQIDCVTRINGNTIEVRPKSSATVAPAENPAELSAGEKKLDEKWIQHARFKETGIRDIASYLETQMNAGRANKDFSVIAHFPASMKDSELPKVSLTLRDVSALTLINYIMEISEMNFTAHEDGIVIHL